MRVVAVAEFKLVQREPVAQAVGAMAQVLAQVRLARQIQVVVAVVAQVVLLQVQQVVQALSLFDMSEQLLELQAAQ